MKGLFKPHICAASIHLAVQKRDRLRADVQKLSNDSDPTGGVAPDEPKTEAVPVVTIDSASDLFGSQYSTSSNSSSGSSSGSSSPSKKWNLLKNRSNEDSAPGSPGKRP